MSGSGVYRTQDPLENFKIKLTVREVSRSTHVINEHSKSGGGAAAGGGGGGGGPFSKEMMLSWQEKVHGPKEIADFIKNRNTKTKSMTQRDSRGHFAAFESGGKTAESQLASVMLYTYIDKDHYSPETVVSTCCLVLLTFTF